MKKTITIVIAAVVFGIVFYSCQKEFDQTSIPANQPAIQRAVAQGGEYEPDEILVQFKKNIATSKKSLLFSGLGSRIKRKIFNKGMEKYGVEEIIVLKVPSGTVMSGIAKLLANNDVAYVSPNYICHAQGGPNDSYYQQNYQWCMYNTVEPPAFLNGARAASAWKNGYTGSSNVWVGIIDGGFKYNNADLIANWGTVPGEIANNGIDDDGNSYVDDVYGYDFLNHDKTIFDGGANEAIHGTGVAGIIGAKGNNGQYIAGVNWNIKMLGGKFMGPNENGDVSNAIEAIYYFIGLKSLHNLNLVAINNSWGTAVNNSFLQQAVNKAQDAGILMICAAGNSGANTDNISDYPSCYTNSNIISVAGTDPNGNLFDVGDGFKSSYGATSVDIAAPGAYIFSTAFTSTGQDAIGVFDGTSFAAPLVTGAAALYKAANPNATYTQIKKRILDTKRPMISLQGKCVTGGILDIGGAMGGPNYGTPAFLDGAVYTFISAVNNSSVIDVTNGSSANGTKLQLYSSNGTNSQKWRVRYNNGLLVFKSLLDTTKVMDVANNSTANGTPIDIWTYNGAYNQIWGTAYNLGYYIAGPRSAFTGQYITKYLDVNGGSSANGTKIQIWDHAEGGYTGTIAPSQLFSILYTPYLKPADIPQ